MPRDGGERIEGVVIVIDVTAKYTATGYGYDQSGSYDFSMNISDEKLPDDIYHLASIMAQQKIGRALDVAWRNVTINNIAYQTKPPATGRRGNDD